MRTRSIFELNGAQVARIIASADFHPQRVSKRLLSVHVAPSFASVLNLDTTWMLRISDSSVVENFKLTFAEARRAGASNARDETLLWLRYR